jgi:CRP/FNR family transcriptional regulator/CRP/FNR family cyclic AMP-dependent transcriptional regulator
MALSTRSVEPVVAPALRACALFRDMDETALAEVAGLLRHRRFRRHEVIFHAGDPGDALFIVVSGSLKIVLPSPEGNEAIIATLRPGDFFGELAVLDGEPRSATAVALEPTELEALARAPFLELVDTQPELRLALLTGLVGELRRLTRHVEELHFLALPGRLAMRLVELAREAAGPGPGAELSWHYTQSDLASMIGGSRQSVSRLLGDLSAQGLLHLERDVIVIPDVELLARMAGR